MFDPCGHDSKPMGSHFGIGAAPILGFLLVVGLVDVHWGYDLGFDPWPYVCIL